VKAARLDSIDTLRGAAAIPVRPSKPAWVPWARELFSLGRSGLPLFFLLSGFCVHRRWALERGPLRFWPLRTAIHWFDWALWGVYDVVLHVLMLHNLDQRTVYSIFGAFWSLAVEEQMYLAYILFMKMRVRWGWGTTLLIGLALREGWLALHLGNVPAGECFFYSWCLFMLGAVCVECECGLAKAPKGSRALGVLLFAARLSRGLAGE